MSLRLKLLLLGLATLVLPWAGCQYAREMEGALREGERSSLAAVAQTIAASLEGRTDLLYRATPPAAPATGPSSSQPADAGPPPFPEAGPYDLKPLDLASAPPLDGNGEDWPRAPQAWAWFSAGPQRRLGVLTGVYQRMLYLLLAVYDAHPVFDAPGADPLDPAGFGDRVWIGFTDPHGLEQQVFLAATGPGAVVARRIEAGEYGQQSTSLEPRIRATWQITGSGYRIQARVPLSMLGERLGVLVDDRDSRGGEAVSYGSLVPDTLHTRGALLAAAPELPFYLAQFLQPGLKLTVTAPDGRVLARADALARTAALGSSPPLLARLYRRFVDRPGARRAIEAGAPVYDSDHARVIGQLQVVQAADRWGGLRDHALMRMLNFTLATSVLAVAAMFAFAAWLALRLSRLRLASESALTRTGLTTEFPETAAPDELGDVARSFATLLSRLDEYTRYLRTLAGKLAHEIRTPLTIVRSSLDNLESEPLPESARDYLRRARQGSERLGGILLAMGAAGRVEEAIGSAERVPFDLVAVVTGAIEAYRGAFPQRRFELVVPATPLTMAGAPDLLVQMLDKLIDNAVDFSPAGGLIRVEVSAAGGDALLSVDNPGPPLAVGVRARLFESLWQSRSSGDSRPHFGLGLYIVRLIAQFHGGTPDAVNLPQGGGVRFTVRLSRN
ncbi:MAG: hypothetical protein JSR67_07925 [Proteobacteria bacterium]|nr:hypothetical protein [Pseudomonadota bacterium]